MTETARVQPLARITAGIMRWHEVRQALADLPVRLEADGTDVVVHASAGARLDVLRAQVAARLGAP